MKGANVLLALLAVSAAGVWGLVVYRRAQGKAQESTDAPIQAPKPVVTSEGSAVPPLVPRSLSVGLPQSGHWRGKPALGDLNSDGHMDLVASIRKVDKGTQGEGLCVWFGDGAGNWTPAHEGIPRDMGYGGSAVADVDGDGHLDIGFSGHDVTPQVFLGDGAGHWKARSAGIDLKGICEDVALGDFDGNGRIALATLGMFPQEGGLHIFEQDDRGWRERDELLPKTSFGAKVFGRDIDGDGKLELIAVTDGGPKVWRHEAQGWKDLSEGLPAPEVGGSDRGIDAADLDGDGKLELVVAGHLYDGHPPLRVFKWDGTRWSLWGTGLPDDEAVFDVTFAKMDGSGSPEIVAAGKSAVTIISMIAPGRFQPRARIEGTVGVLNIAAGDVNGDGRDEIVLVRFGSVQVLDVQKEKRGGQ